MSYINSVNVGGSTYNLRDEEAIHDVSALATKEELNNYATKEELNNMSGGSNVNMFVDGSTLVLMSNSGGGNGGSGSSEVIMAEFPVSSITTNSEGHTVVALEGLTDLYNNEQARQNLQNSTFTFRWVDSRGSNRGQNGQFHLANSATEEFPAGPGENEKMWIDWNAGTLTFNNGFPEGVVKVLLIHEADGNNGGGSEGPNFTDVYTTNISNISRPDSTKYVYTVDDSAFANLANTISSYSENGWNGAFRTSTGSQWGFGSFPLIAATSAEDGFDGYKATSPDGILLAFNSADNTITFNQSADQSDLQNATVFVLQRVL